jgi:hypothetical protein
LPKVSNFQFNSTKVENKQHINIEGFMTWETARQTRDRVMTKVGNITAIDMGWPNRV